MRYSERVGVRPMIGLRVKLASRGSGRWRSSGGYRSKFGLSVSEAVRMLQELKDAGMADCLNLLHFHLGSQITNIRQIKAAVNEAVRVYVDCLLYTSSGPESGRRQHARRRHQARHQELEGRRLQGVRTGYGANRIHHARAGQACRRFSFAECGVRRDAQPRQFRRQAGAARCV